MVNTVDGAAKAEILVSIPAGVYQYVEGEMRLPAGLPDGEYAYTLKADGRTLSQGLAIVGEYTRIPDGSGVQDIDYRQYGE